MAAVPVDEEITSLTRTPSAINWFCTATRKCLIDGNSFKTYHRDELSQSMSTRSTSRV